MALFDKIKKPDLSGIGQKLKDAAGEVSAKGKQLAETCADGISSASAAVGSVASDIAENTLSGIQIAGDAISGAASSVKEKLQGLSVKGMFESVDMSGIIANIGEYGDKFNESSFMKKIKETASKVGGVLIYNVMLLWNMATSGEVSLKDKTMIFGALGYFILPADAIPDVIAGIGYLDDMGSITYVLGKVQSSITPGIQKAARERTAQILGHDDETWYQDPEEAYASSKDMSDDTKAKYGEALKFISKFKK